MVFRDVAGNPAEILNSWRAEDMRQAGGFSIRISPRSRVSPVLTVNSLRSRGPVAVLAEVS